MVGMFKGASVAIRSDGSCDEELRAIGVFARVGHAQQPLFGVLELEVLVCKLVAIDGLSASAYPSVRSVTPDHCTGSHTITIGKVTALNHKGLDDSVESGALVAISFLARSQSTEVLYGSGNGSAIEAHGYPANVFVAMLNVKIDLSLVRQHQLQVQYTSSVEQHLLRNLGAFASRLSSLGKVRINRTEIAMRLMVAMMPIRSNDQMQNQYGKRIR